MADTSMTPTNAGYTVNDEGQALDMDQTAYGDVISVTQDDDGRKVRVALYANGHDAIRLSYQEARTLARMLHRACNTALAKDKAANAKR
jgi:hypothetical protein